MKKKYSYITTQCCLIAFILIVAGQCAFGQITRYPVGLNEVNDSITLSSILRPKANVSTTTPPYTFPHSEVPETKANYNEGKWRWNNHQYFKSNPQKRKALNWNDYNETFDVKQCAIWGIFALSGVAHGMREAYHADQYVFETTWNADKDGFWGSDAWKRNYHGNDPTQGHKHEYLANFGRDIWHTADEFDVFGLSLASIGTGFRKQPFKYRAANWLIGMGVRTLFARITYDTLR
jgi:hypothetical protein